MSATNGQRLIPQGQNAGLAILYRCLATILFTIMWATSKLAAQEGVNTVEIIFYRTLFATPVIVTVLALGSGIQGIVTYNPMAHVKRSAIGLVSMFFTFYAIALLPMAEATTIGFTTPIFATIMSALILREKIGRQRWAATFIGFGGVLIVMQSGFAGHTLPLLGLGVGLLSAFGIALVNITIRQISNAESATATVFWFTMSCVTITGALMPWFGHVHPWHIIGYLVITGTTGTLAQLLMTTSLRLGPIALVVPFDYTQLIWASLIGWLLWGAIPLMNTLTGSVLIIGAGLWTLYREHFHKLKRPPPLLP